MINYILIASFQSHCGGVKRQNYENSVTVNLTVDALYNTNANKIESILKYACFLKTNCYTWVLCMDVSGNKSDVAVTEFWKKAQKKKDQQIKLWP